MRPALKRCSEPGCCQYVTGSKCEAHAKSSSKNRPGDPFYSSRRWRALRKRFLEENPVCIECEKAGRLTMATIVDHVLPRAERPDLEWDWDNFAALCRSHHNAKSAREQAVKAKG